MVVDFLHFLDPGYVDLVGTLRLKDAAERENHVVGCERRAVVKFNAFAQVETPLRRRDLLPARRECRLHLEIPGVADHAFVGMLQDAVRGRVVLRMRIERENVVLRRPSQACGMRGRGHSRERGNRDQGHGGECCSERSCELHVVLPPLRYLSGSASSTSAAR